MSVVRGGKLPPGYYYIGNQYHHHHDVPWFNFNFVQAEIQWIEEATGTTILKFLKRTVVEDLEPLISEGCITVERNCFDR
jgi:hypothetical protein